MVLSFTSFAALAYLSVLTMAAKYSQTDSITGSKFLSEFTVEAISDPTHGRVYVSELFLSYGHFSDSLCRNYVSASTAKSQNLTYASGNTFVMRADYKSTLSSSGAGRNSVRMQSNKQYTTAVMV